MARERLQSWRRRTHRAELLPLSLALTVLFPAISGSSGQDFLTYSRATTVVLLIGVIRAGQRREIR